MRGGLVSMASMVLLASWLIGCAGGQRSVANNSSLIAADTAFDADVALRGVEGWLDWFEDDIGTWKNHEIVRGKENYRATIGPLLSKAGNALRWTPVWADGDGAFGFTTGRWALHVKGDDGKETITGTGTYCTVWHRQPDGRWKIVFDIGNDDRK